MKASEQMLDFLRKNLLDRFIKEEPIEPLIRFLEKTLDEQTWSRILREVEKRLERQLEIKGPLFTMTVKEKEGIVQQKIEPTKEAERVRKDYRKHLKGQEKFWKLHHLIQVIFYEFCYKEGVSRLDKIEKLSQQEQIKLLDRRDEEVKKVLERCSIPIEVIRLVLGFKGNAIGVDKYAAIGECNIYRKELSEILQRILDTGIGWYSNESVFSGFLEGKGVPQELGIGALEESMKKVCIKCGRKGIDPLAKFCPGCSAELPTWI